MNSTFSPAPQHIPLYRRYHAIAGNWEFSLRSLLEIRQRLQNGISESGVTIAVAGSLGRLEASPQSDLDFIIVARDDSIDVSAVRSKIESLIHGLGFQLPKADGVFSESSTQKTLIEGVGSAEENLGHLARRMLLLM